jgi:hypothetical protein
VLVGVSTYRYAEFPPVRAARNSMNVMRSLLADPDLCGWPPEQITVIADPNSAAGLADRVAELAEDTTGVLLLYYVGHGVLSASGELCLTVTSTRPNRPKITGLPWDTLADVLRTCPARVRLAILDCCFAGQAIEALGGDGAVGLADVAHVEGVYTLTATTRNRTAHVPPLREQDTACTSFTGELRDLIRSGIPGKTPLLTFSDIYPVLRQRLRAKGMPAPSQRGTNTAHQFPFTANAAARAGTTIRGTQSQSHGHDVRDSPQQSPEPAQGSQSRQSRILDDAQRAAWSLTDALSKAFALSNIVEALGVTDPDRAARLIIDTEEVAQSISDQDAKATALRFLADAAAVAVPSRADPLIRDAERAAYSISDQDAKATALAALVETVAATDPDRAADIAQSITDQDAKEEALTNLTHAVAATDPDRAEGIARSITSQNAKAIALADLAHELTVTDPERAARLGMDAERAARSIIDEFERTWALSEVAGTMAATDPDRAERIAHSITNQNAKATALAHLAYALAVTDPDRAARLASTAERIADSITHASLKTGALVDIASIMLDPDPGRGARLIEDAELTYRSITDEASKSRLLPQIMAVMARTDPDRAERIAAQANSEELQKWALHSIVEFVKFTDPDRAERIARSITDDAVKAYALASVAQAAEAS